MQCQLSARSAFRYLGVLDVILSIKKLCSLTTGCRGRQPGLERTYVMNRKLSLALAAVTLVAAFASGAATASAANDPQLTTSGGVLVPVGTSNIQLTQVGETGVFNTEGTTKILTCTSGTGAGSVIKNSGGTVEGEITSLIIGGTGPLASGEPANECTSSFGNVSMTPVLPLCLRSTPTMAADEMQIAGGKCSAPGNVKYIVAGTTSGVCEYESTSPLKLDFTTTPSDAQATIRTTSAGSGIKLIKGGFLCPTSATLQGTRTMEDTSGNPFFVS